MTRYFISLLVALALFPINVEAQGWEKFHDRNGGVYKSTPDGGIIVLGSETFEEAVGIEKRPFWIAFDSNGEILWEYYANGLADINLRIDDFIITDAGNILISMRIGISPSTNRTLVLNISLAGNINWLYEFTGTNTYVIKSMVQLGSGEFILVGDTRIGSNEDVISIFKLNKQGELVWNKEESTDESIRTFNVIEDKNEDILFTGYQVTFGSLEKDIVLFKYSSSGEQIFEKIYSKPSNEYPVKLMTGEDDNYFLYGQVIDEFGPFQFPCLFNIDVDGNEIWYKEYSGFGEFMAAGDFVLGVDNGVLLNGRLGLLNQNIDLMDAFLLKLDDNGNAEWIKNYGRNKSDGFSFLFSKDQSYYSAGFSERASSIYIYLLKTDVNGVSLSNEFSGRLYLDEDLTCHIDTNEFGLKNWLITAEKGEDLFYCHTNEMGDFHFVLDTGIYDINVHNISDYWEICDQSISIEFIDSNQVINQDIGAQADIYCPLMDVSIATPFLRRCFPNTYTIQYCNLGTQLAEDAYLEVTLDTFMTVISTEIPIATQVDNLLTFELGDVELGECYYFDIEVQLGDTTDCDALPLGYTHCVVAHIYPDSICNFSPNWSGASLEVDAICTGDSIIFTITNVGTDPMAQASDYIVIEDDVILMIGTVNLGVNEFVEVSFVTNGGTFRIEVDQEVDHPGMSMPSVSIEHCGDDNSVFSLGFVNIFAQDDADNFVDIDCQQNMGAYDPNDKRGFPRGYEEAHYINKGQAIEYLIRFQNTGNDTAFNVVVRDTISEFMNIASVRPGASSHDYGYTVSPDGVLEFRFDNILLPDSTTHLAGSNGFVKFKIDQNIDLDIGTEILNSAAIYFDFNAPIITNQTWHTIERPLLGTVSIDPIPENAWQVLTAPNPFENQVEFLINGVELKESNFSLYSTNGQLIQSASFEGQQYHLSANALPSGLYFFTIRSEGKRIASGKMVKQ